MAYRLRRRWSGRRDVFPLRVAAGGLVLFALLITLAVWAALPAESDAPPERAANPTPAELPEPESSVGSSTTRQVNTAGATAEAAGTGAPPAFEAPVVASDESSMPRAPAPPASLEPRAAAQSAHAQGLRSFREGDYARAAARFAEAVRGAPSSAEYRNDHGWALFRAGRLAEAEPEIAAALRLDPRRAIAHANLAEVLLTRGDTAAGVASYRRFLELNADPQRERAAQERLRRLAPARQAVAEEEAPARLTSPRERGAPVPERRPSAARSAAATAARASKDPDSRSSVASEPAASTEDAPAMRVVTASDEGPRGDVALREGRFGAAAVHYQRAVTLEPRNAEFRTGYARALFHHGALPEAATQLEQVVIWNPGHADAWVLLGEVRYAQNYRARASEAYQRYLELESNARLRASAEARLREITGEAGTAPRS